MKTKLRLKITEQMCDNISYLVIDKNRHITHVNQHGIPLSLSNICANSTEFKFAIEDADNEEDILQICKSHCLYVKKIEVL